MKTSFASRTTTSRTEDGAYPNTLISGKKTEMGDETTTRTKKTSGAAKTAGI